MFRRLKNCFFQVDLSTDRVEEKVFVKDVTRNEDEDDIWEDQVVESLEDNDDDMADFIDDGPEMIVISSDSEPEAEFTPRDRSRRRKKLTKRPQQILSDSESEADDRPSCSTKRPRPLRISDSSDEFDSFGSGVDDVIDNLGINKTEDEFDSFDEDMIDKFCKTLKP